MRFSTWRIRTPFGGTLALSVLLLSTLFAAGEVVARSRLLQRWLVPGWSSDHRQFEIQLTRLQDVIDREGNIDCIFFGNSMVLNGFDPEAFTSAYRNQRGETLRCFNFGVDGLTGASAGALAEILVNDYHPRLLIYGTDARDYTIAKEARDTSVILNSSWVRYRSGQFSPIGWLTEHSYLFRYFEPLGNVMQFTTLNMLRSDLRASYKLPYGFYPDPRVSTSIDTPPNREAEDWAITYYFGILSDYEIRPENLAGLQQIVSQRLESPQLLIVEMPVPETYMDFFGNGKQDYSMFIEQVSQTVESAGIPFWQTSYRQLIPGDGWADYAHLNPKGASIFSQWFAQEVVRATTDDTLRVSIGD